MKNIIAIRNMFRKIIFFVWKTSFWKSKNFENVHWKSIEQQKIQGGEIYYVSLQTEKRYNEEEYRFKYDLNGKYIISVSENRNKNTESDYALVKFTLSSNKLQNQNIYIYGELTNWDILPEAKMNYNKNSKIPNIF